MVFAKVMAAMVFGLALAHKHETAEKINAVLVII